MEFQKNLRKDANVQAMDYGAFYEGPDSSKALSSHGYESDDQRTFYLMKPQSGPAKRLCKYVLRFSTINLR